MFFYILLSFDKSVVFVIVRPFIFTQRTMLVFTAFAGLFLHLTPPSFGAANSQDVFNPGWTWSSYSSPFINPSVVAPVTSVTPVVVPVAARQIMSIERFTPPESVAPYRVSPNVSYDVVGKIDDYTQRTLDKCKERVVDAYNAIPADHRAPLGYLTLVWQAGVRRGLGGDGGIRLRCNDVGDDELVSVFVHEIGHIVDTGLLSGVGGSAEASVYSDPRETVMSDDPSVDFYRISWSNDSRKISGSSMLDFVTGYATTDPFEDFAESYDFYILHGSQFKYMARYNARLSQKYAYLRDHVFGGREYVNNSYKLSRSNRNYDSTVLPFSLDNFLKSM